MNREEIFDSLKEILLQSVDDPSLDPSSIKMEDELSADLHVNSISALYMALEIESRFGVSLLNEDTERMKRVEDVVSLIEEKLK